ncbi:hypothetical protein IW261DRAFT_1423936 [Armillaria novae-zelandiae]|uniref:Uncharacterized protein n=1 Tax=Armillaria novae-zelandiae TaxID=153914 RepID=A0AA39NWG4_9AGAR|nr:hypothetical protein IW261DRAFT_1423936 [Armillaria novae-zelandiae]
MGQLNTLELKACQTGCQDSTRSSSLLLAEAVILLPLSSGTEDQQLCKPANLESLMWPDSHLYRHSLPERNVSSGAADSDHKIPPSRADFLKVNSVGSTPTSLSFEDHVMPTNTNVDSHPVDATKDTTESLRYISSHGLSTLGSNSDNLHPRYRVKNAFAPRHVSDLPPPSLLSLCDSARQQIDIKASLFTDREPKPNRSIRYEDVITSPNVLWSGQSGHASDFFPSFRSDAVQDSEEVEACLSIFPNNHDTSSSARFAEHPITDLEQGSPSFTTEAVTITHSDSIDEADRQIRDKATATEISFGIDDAANQVLPGGLSVDQPVAKFTDLNLDFFSAYNGIVEQLDVLAERYGFHSILAMAGDDPHKVPVAGSYETSKAKKFFEEKLHCPRNQWIETHLRLHVQNNTLEEGLELHRRHLMTDSHFAPPELTVFHLGLEHQHAEEPARQPGHRQQGNALSLMNDLLDRHGIKVTRPNMFPWRTLGKILASTGKLLAGWPIQVHLPMLNKFDGDAFSKLPEDFKEMLRVALVEETLTIEEIWGFSQGRI